MEASRYRRCYANTWVEWSRSEKNEILDSIFPPPRIFVLASRRVTSDMEGWRSGRTCQSWKLETSQGVREFKSRPLRQWHELDYDRGKFWHWHPKNNHKVARGWSYQEKTSLDLPISHLQISIPYSSRSVIRLIQTTKISLQIYEYFQLYLYNS